MSIWMVNFPNNRQMQVNSGETESEAMSKAFMMARQPIYCRIHSEIAAYSDKPAGEMGFYHPPSSYPINATRMKEVYMDCGYCLIPA